MARPPTAPARIGLVLGAGGVPGGAWHAGALAALADRSGWDARSAEVIVGTSAGSITGAGLRTGLSATDLWALSVDQPLSVEGARLNARVTARGEDTMVRSRLGRAGPANPGLMAAMMGRRPRPGVALAGLLPAGGVSTGSIATRITQLAGTEDFPRRPLWVVAVDLGSGRRVVFGRDDIDGVTLGAAVAASCAVPAFFAPVAIDGRRYVDGGVHSTTNADLLAGADLDLVVVSAPMAGRWRSLRPHPAALTRTAARVSLDREVRAIRASGPPVLVLQPGPEDTRLMDGRSLDPGVRVPMGHRARQSVAAMLDRPEVGDRLAILQRAG